MKYTVFKPSFVHIRNICRDNKWKLATAPGSIRRPGMAVPDRLGMDEWLTSMRKEFSNTGEAPNFAVARALYLEDYWYSHGRESVYVESKELARFIAESKYTVDETVIRKWEGRPFVLNFAPGYEWNGVQLNKSVMCLVLRWKEVADHICLFVKDSTNAKSYDNISVREAFTDDMLTICLLHGPCLGRVVYNICVLEDVDSCLATLAAPFAEAKREMLDSTEGLKSGKLCDESKIEIAAGYSCLARRMALGFMVYADCFKESLLAGQPGLDALDKLYGVKEKSIRLVANSAIGAMDQDSGGRCPHYRRGHFRTFHDDRYVKMKGQTIFVGSCFVGKIKPDPEVLEDVRMAV